MKGAEMLKTVRDIVNPIDPSKITGPYGVLAVFLLVLQVSIGVWFAAAANGTERIVAGLIFAALFLVFLFVLVRLQAVIQRSSLNIIEQPGEISTEDIGKEEVEQEQIETSDTQTLTAPDGSFDIHEPPMDWEVKELTVSEWWRESLGIQSGSSGQVLQETDHEDQTIMVFEAKRRTQITPVPGVTRSEGRFLPTALEISMPTRLAIVPLQRYRPPFFIERSLMHSLLAEIAVQPVYLTGPMTLRKIRRDTTKHTNRELIEIGFFQNVENAIVDGRNGSNVTSTATFIAIEGYVRDHLLMLSYSFIPTNEENPELEHDVSVLQSLVNSFRPLKVFNREDKRSEINRAMDQEFEQSMELAGESMFYAEFSLFLRRLRNQNLDNVETLLDTIKLLKNFELLAHQVGLENERFNKLWRSLRQADQGNFTELKIQLIDLLNRNTVHLLLSEAYGEGDLDVIAECVEKEYVDHSEDSETPPGPEGYKDVVEFWRSVLGDLRLDFEERISEGDKVAFRWTMSGTHQDEIMGVAPTGDEVTLTGTTIYRFTGGKVVEAWTVRDDVGLLRQINYPLPSFET